MHIALHFASMPRAIAFWCFLARALFIASVCLIGTAHAQANAPANAPAPVVLVQGGKSMALDGQMRVWVDASNQASIDTVHGLGDDSFSLLPLRKDLQRNGSPLWFRMVLQVPEGESPWFLSVRQITTDHVDLYTQNAQGAWQVQKSGTAVPVAQWPLPDFRPTFQFDPHPSGTRTVYLRLADPVGSYANVRIAPLPAWTQERTTELWLMGLFFGAAGVVLLLCILNWLTYRESVWLSYALYSASMAMMQGAILGLNGQYFYPNHPWINDFGTYLWTNLTCVFGSLFAVRASSALRLVRRWAYFMRFFAAALLVSLLCLALYREPVVVSIFYTLITATCCFLPLTFILGWRAGDRFSPLALLAFLPLAMLALPQMAYNFSIVQRSWLTEYLLAFGVAVETVLMLYFLHRRSRQGAVTRSRLMQDGQDDSLTGLLKARETLTRLDGMLKRTRKAHKSMGTILLGLLNYEAIRREHGREVADTALIVMAQHIQSVCGDLDTPGRVDANRYLVCLEGHLPDEKLKSIGSALIAKGLRPSKYLPTGLTLDFALVLSLLDGNEPNANEVLRQMDEKFDEFKATDAKRMLVCRVRGLAPDDPEPEGAMA